MVYKKLNSLGKGLGTGAGVSGWRGWFDGIACESVLSLGFNFNLTSNVSFVVSGRLGLVESALID